MVSSRGAAGDEDDDIPLLELAQRRKRALDAINAAVDYLDERFVDTLEEDIDADYVVSSSETTSTSTSTRSEDALACEAVHLETLESDARAFEADVSRQTKNDKRKLMAAADALRPAKWSDVRAYFNRLQRPPKFAITHNEDTYTAIWSQANDEVAADDGQVFASPMKWAEFVGAKHSSIQVFCEEKVWALAEIYERCRSCR